MKTESKIVIDTKEKLLEHFGKPEGNFFWDFRFIYDVIGKRSENSLDNDG